LKTAAYFNVGRSGHCFQAFATGKYCRRDKVVQGWATIGIRLSESSKD
jgi:hypothetical protein